jgi:Zn finger protein HypA/HybF involved in hydrogenase expression
MGPADNVEPLVRTLEQELTALMRGLSLECLVCGEFVMHAQAGVVFCPECGSQFGDESALADDPGLGFDRVQSGTQAG